MPRPDEVVLVSFEGPDRYAFVGGLATRMNDLAEALAGRGQRVRHVFLGDPTLPPTEERFDGRLRLERWSQWISALHPKDVYDGEEGKRRDLATSLPPHLADAVVAPVAAACGTVTILFEDWQTAAAAIATDALLTERGLRGSATLLWNSNNTYGYDRLDFPALERAAVITTVSRYMRAETLRIAGVDAQVLPNGIAQRFLAPVAPQGPARLRAAFGDRPTFVKVARFDADKRWLWAVDAIAVLRDQGERPRLVLRGSRSDYGARVLDRAEAHQLRLARLTPPDECPTEVLAEAIEASDADVVVLDSFIGETTLRQLYAAADGVLANSEKEPFGLVGLEVMASGGLAFLGRTGEDYAIPYGNAVVVQTDDPRELAAHLAVLRERPRLVARMRREGRATAERYAWPNVLPAYDAAWEAALRLRL